MTLKTGAKVGRWTVTRPAPPARRYGEPYTRARVWVRCVCGHEQLVFVATLQADKTHGCRDRGCELRARARRMARAQLADLLERIDDAGDPDAPDDDDDGGGADG